MTHLDSITLLAERALRSATDSEDRLAVYDAVATAAGGLCELIGKEDKKQSEDLGLLWTKAEDTAKAIRDADKCQLDFSELLGGAQ